MDLQAYGRKAIVYLDELVYAARLPTSLADRSNLVKHTVGFHWQNWRKSPIDPNRLLEFSIAVSGRSHRVTLRPYAGDMSIFYEVMLRRAYNIAPDILAYDDVETIIDAGGHIGMAALYLADRYPSARIISLEPNPDNFAILEKNVSAEPRITPIQACLTGVPKSEVFISTSGRTSHFQINARGEGKRVQGLCIDQICKMHQIDRIDLLKMDIEGAERDVFAHPSFLNRVGAVVAELHAPYDEAKFASDVQPFGLSVAIQSLADDTDTSLAYRRRE